MPKPDTDIQEFNLSEHGKMRPLTPLLQYQPKSWNMKLGGLLLALLLHLVLSLEDSAVAAPWLPLPGRWVAREQGLRAPSGAGLLREVRCTYRVSNISLSIYLLGWGATSTTPRAEA